MDPGLTGRDCTLFEEPAGADGEPGPGESGTMELAEPAERAHAAALPLFDDAARSPDPSVCPFLRREDAGTLAVPWSAPSDEHRCIAIGVPRPQSTRQQELVCLRAAHADCPRYLRGAGDVSSSIASHAGRAVPRATLVALLILVLSAGISFGFVVRRGGIDMPVAVVAATATPLAAVAASGTPLGEGTPAPASSPSPTPVPPTAGTPTPTPGSSSSPTPAVSPTTAASPTPTASPAAASVSSRYAVLVPCPGRAGCYRYTVRAGDNLTSIAHWFGVSIATIYAWNPTYARGAGLRAGNVLEMPPPTR
jgi:hypothetical protein